MKSSKKTLGKKPARRRALATGRELVRVEPLLEGQPYPLCLRPVQPGLELVPWVSANRDWLEELYRTHRALLFRGFDEPSIERFEATCDLLSEGERLPYRDRSTPRQSYGQNVYCTTIYPSEQRIRLHNEGSYWAAWAQKAFFGCITAPDQGGATPIGDVHGVYCSLPARIRDAFRERGILYVRNYNDGFSLPWQEVFQTTDRSEVEAYCASNGIRCEWKSGDRLRTTTYRTAIQNHPRTGEPLWFNHAAFFHVSALEPAVRDALLQEFEPEDLPYNTYYGDGGELEAEDVREILEAYDQAEIRFDWHPGDIHWIDNMRLAHGREPYVGERLILVSLTEAYAPPSVLPKAG